MSDSAFLTAEELRELTGYSQKSRQVIQLRDMGIAFFTNACGHPIVARATIEGRKANEAANEKTWEPAWAVNQR